ncbi:hypothetical protein GBA52_019979 [Prunus armeniaca]|nr:hypothetical protein GBA52_019979 [Prunus armeniaca]
MELVLTKWVCTFLLCSWLIFSGVYSVEGLHGDSKVRGVNLGGWLVVEGWIKPSLFDGIPNGDMLDGTQVQLKSVTLEKYVSAENGGGMNVSVSRDVASSWETFTLWRVSESEFQFRTLQGQFLTCDDEGCSFSATAESPSTLETFFVEKYNNGRVHIKTTSGTYLQATVENQLIADYPGKPGWDDNAATFEMTIVSNNLHGDYQLANGYAHNKAKEVLKNGMEHSASRDGSTDWPNPDYISQTLHVIDFLASRYARHPALLGIELLNEPSAATVPLDILVSYYNQGYQTVRKHSSTAYVIVCQRIGNADPLEVYHANIGSRNLVVDLHYYNLFDNFFVNMSAVDNIQFIYKSRETQLEALNSANGPLVFIGEWVNEWNVTSGSQKDYQDFGRVQLEVYNAASFGWAYWTLKNDRPHWDFEWNIRNNYLQLGNSPKKRNVNGLALLGLTYVLFYLHHTL